MSATDVEIGTIEAEELYEIFDEDLECEAKNIHTGDEPASWQVRLKCCGKALLFCNTCLEKENLRAMKYNRVGCSLCGKDWGVINSIYTMAWVTAI
jgi:hypothetical protein